MADQTIMTHHPAPSAAAGLMRLAYGLAYAVRPQRLLHPLGFVRLATEKTFGKGHGSFLRSPSTALEIPDGLVDIGGPMSTERLIEAYSRGIFPWCHIGPVKWWSPSTRAVLFLSESRIEKSTRRLIRQGRYSVTFDHAFRRVMEACAEPRPGRPALTWISPLFMDAYEALHEQGHAHSVEVWDSEGRLVGGLYGVASGGVFFTESQFARERDTSKIAFVTLNRHLAEWGFVLNDGKDMTGHLAALGMREIPRKAFLAILADAAQTSRPPGIWKVDAGLDVAGWQPGAKA